MAFNRVQIMLLQAILLTTSLAPGIVIRHDVDDARYRCNDVCHATTAFFHLGGRFGAGTGTLIASQWVLTAAHVAEHVSKGDSVTVAGRQYRVAEVEMHPRAAREAGFVDAALVRLASPVESVGPAGLYDRSDEAGQVIRFEGHGWTGNGLDGLKRTERATRMALNRIDATRDHWLIFDFDSPDDDALPLEGISGPGDSGGPAYRHGPGPACVLGISSWQDNDGEEGVYGVREYYVRVSAVIPWVQEVTGVTSGCAPTRSESATGRSDDRDSVRFPRDKGRSTIQMASIKRSQQSRQESKGSGSFSDKVQGSFWQLRCF